jgi:hypothetical protein
MFSQTCYRKSSHRIIAAAAEIRPMRRFWAQELTTQQSWNKFCFDNLVNQAASFGEAPLITQ